jgi:LuxR family maltose regulon positive regulatory protein
MQGHAKAGSVATLTKSKFSHPKIKSEWIVRENLNNKPTLETRVTLIQAPAGYGKSTFAVQWLNQVGSEFAWLGLDSYDNNPARFWRYCIAALQSLFAGVGESAEQRLKEGQFHSVDDMASALLNDVADHPRGQGVFLVLDDFHLITNADIIAGIQYFIRYLPDALHLVLISRNESDVSRRQLGDTSAVQVVCLSDLQLSPAQAADMLARQYGDAVSDTVADTIYQLTEGWIAGVQLLGMYLNKESESSLHLCYEQFLAWKNGSDLQQSALPENLMNYFLREVLNDIDPQEKTLLMTLALFPRISVGLCRCVFASGATLDQVAALLKQNVFLIPIEGQVESFRFHDLFRAVLLVLAKQYLSADTILAYQRSAIAWMNDNKEAESALYFAVDNQLWHEASDCLQSILIKYRRKGDYQRVAECVELLPGNVIESQLQIIAPYCWSLANMDRTDILRFYLDKGAQLFNAKLNQAPMEQWPKTEQSKGMDFLITLSIADRLSGIYTKQHSLRTFECAARIGFPYLTKVNLELGQDLYMLGELDSAQQHFLDSIHYAMQDKEPYALAVAATFLHQVTMQTGAVNDAIAKLELLLHWLGNANLGAEGMAIMSIISLSLFCLRQECNQDHDPAVVRELVYALTRPSVSSNNQWIVLIFAYRFAMNQQHYQQAETILNQLHELEAGRAMKFRVGMASLDALYAELALCSGGANRAEQQRIEHWVRQHDAADSASVVNSSDYYLAQERVILARCLFRVGEFAQAVNLAQSIIDVASPPGWQAHRLRAYAILYSVNTAQGDVEQAAVVLAQIQDIIQATQFHCLLLDLCREFPLLYQALKERGASHLVVDANPGAEFGHDDSNPALSEALSEREMQVLLAASEGLSNPDIADKLFISVNTVKTHLQKVYGKIQVKSRTQAIRKAQSMGLFR